LEEKIFDDFKELLSLYGLIDGYLLKDFLDNISQKLIDQLKKSCGGGNI
jgi:hypothetical protein